MEETLAPDVSVLEVSRRSGVDPSLLYRWRRRMLGAQPRLPAFTPVTVTANDAIAPRPPEPGVIEVEVARGSRARPFLQRSPR